MHIRKLVATGSILSSLVLGCSPRFRNCESIDAALLEAIPERLSETGLFADVLMATVADGVRADQPRVEPWRDGATKRRWMLVPPGTAIDTSDPDNWNFPAGTKIWKEFTRDGVRVETRLLFKHGDAWTPVAYVWRSSDEAWS